MRNEIEFIKKAQAGDKKAQNKILSDNSGLIKKIAGKYTIPGLLDEDLVQIGMDAVLEALKGYQEDKSAFSTYITAAINNRFKTELRKANNNRNRALNTSETRLVGSDGSEVDIIDTIADTSYDDDDDFTKEELDRIVEEVGSKAEIEIYKLRLAGKTNQEIAKKLNKTAKAVSQTMTRLGNKVKDKRNS